MVNPTGLIDVEVQNTYDFVGNLTQSVEDYDGQVNKTITKKFTYDHAGRLEKTTHEINADDYNNEVVLAENHYNELGQLMLKKLHSANDTSFVQDIDYLYDVRGWLTKINNFTDTIRNKLYVQSLDYYANGNISNMNWKNTIINNEGWVDPTSKMEYTFTYDNLNRLGAATYKEYLPAGGSNSGYFDTSYGYDLNGNITSLQRDGNKNDSNAPSPSYGLIDNLTYTYPTSSNLLTSVSDAATGVNHDLEYKTAAGSYVYDDNGNATTVPGKGTVSYNYLNLPQQITVAGQGTINYLYDAAGNKLKKTAGGTTYYQGNVLEISGQDIILTGEGRAVYANSQWNYEYDLKDHLGNTRVSFKVDTVRAEPLQYKDYYPFGMEMAQWYGIEGTPTKYLYNGKELQDEYGLDWYDYGARFYDPALGRWHVVDPLAENYNAWTPYNYTLNNPILFIDPDGRATTYNWETERYEDEDGNERSWEQTKDEYNIGSSNDSEGSGLKDIITSFFDSFISQFSITDNKGELYEEHSKGNELATKEVERRNIMNGISNTEITPYVSIGYGKETAEGSPLSGFGSLTFTSKSIYFTAGADLTLSAPSLIPGPSISVSAGFFTGPSSGISGLGYGYGVGSNIGVSSSRSLSFNKYNGTIPFSHGNTKSYGLTFTTTPAWGSVNLGYTWDLLKK